MQKDSTGEQILSKEVEIIFSRMLLHSLKDRADNSTIGWQAFMEHPKFSSAASSIRLAYNDMLGLPSGEISLSYKSLIERTREEPLAVKGYVLSYPSFIAGCVFNGLPLSQEFKSIIQLDLPKNLVDAAMSVVSKQVEAT